MVGGNVIKAHLFSQLFFAVEERQEEIVAAEVEGGRIKAGSGKGKRARQCRRRVRGRWRGWRWRRRRRRCGAIFNHCPIKDDFTRGIRDKRMHGVVIRASIKIGETGCAWEGACKNLVGSIHEQRTCQAADISTKSVKGRCVL